MTDDDDTLEEVFADMVVDPSLARLRNEGQTEYPRGNRFDPVVALLVDTPYHILGDEWEDLLRVSPNTPYLTYVFKYRSKPQPEEWAAMKALTAREVRLVKPKVWLTEGHHSAEMLGQKWPPLHGATVGFTPSGTPVLYGTDWSAMLDWVPRLLNSGEEFVKT